MTAGSANPLDRWIAARLGVPVLTREALSRHQMLRLGETLAWARERSSFYRDHLAGIGPVDGLDGLERLPFTAAQDLRDDPTRFVCVSQSAIRRVVTLDSSGTTGQPKRLFFTGEDLEGTVDFFHHGLSQMVEAGETLLILLPGARPGSVGDLLVAAAGRLGAQAVVHGFATDPEAAGEALLRHRPALAIGVPVQVLALARLARIRGWRFEGLRRVLLCSDSVPDALAAELERHWGVEVFRDWGMTELGYGGGVDCACHRGYHLQEADFLFEIVDPASGRPLAAGEEGEIVVTTLMRRGMPLIRYRTGDLSRRLPGACACGSVLGRLDRIGPRREGRIDLGGGGWTSIGILDEALLGRAGLADFSATLVAGAPATLRVVGPRFLALDADGIGLERRVRAALDTVPAIHSACLAGLLRVEVLVSPLPLPPWRGKRGVAREGAR